MAVPKYLFRFDAGDQYGLGHYSRSVAVARALYEVESTAHISILTEATAFMVEKKEELPFQVLLEEDMNQKVLLAYVKDIRPDVLFFDKLEELKEDTIRELRRYTSVILFHNYSRCATWADAVIIPAAHISEDRLPFLHTANPGPAALYIGPAYVTINEAVLPLKNRFKLAGSVSTIAITTGGTDPKGVMVTLLGKIRFNEFQDISFKCLIGEGFIHKDKLAPFYEIPNVSFAPFETDAFIHSDITIATFGVTTYELLYLGIPVISVAHALPNAEGSRYLSTHYNCIADLGYIDQVNEEGMNATINAMVEDINIRRNYHEKGVGLIDGKGVERVRDIILHIKSKS